MLALVYSSIPDRVSLCLSHAREVAPTFDGTAIRRCHTNFGDQSNLFLPHFEIITKENRLFYLVVVTSTYERLMYC